MRISSVRTIFGSVEAHMMLLTLTMMSLLVHFACAACPSATSGAPLLDGCAQPCTMSPLGTTFHNANRAPLCSAHLCLLSNLQSFESGTSRYRFEAISLVDPKVAQLAALAAQRFSRDSPRAMKCMQHGEPLQIVGPPAITSACSQARGLPACALHRLFPDITAWHTTAPLVCIVMR